MKKIIFLAALFVSVIGFAQVKPTRYAQFITPSSYPYLQAQRALLIPEDTVVHAQDSLFVHLVGMGGKLFMFDKSVNNFWFEITGTGGGGGIDDINGLIQAGSNVTITGSGTAGDPYIINSTSLGGGGGGGSAVTTKVIPLTAFKDKRYFTKEEANKWIRTNLTGTDTVGFFRATPDSLYAIERKEIMPGLENYEAFPIIAYSPVTGTMLITYQLSRSHAGNSAAAYIRSTDLGRTWSGRKYMAERVTGSDYKAAAIIARPDNGWWYAAYDNGIGNTLGLNPRIFNMKISKNDGVSFDSLVTFDFTSVYGYRTTASSHTFFISKAGTQFLPTYGLDANNTNFETWMLRSTNWFQTYTLVRVPQDSSVHKFNETTLLEKGDTLYAFQRSEALAGPYLYRSYSLDDGVTWSSPVAITYSGRSTRPNIVLMPDGRMMITQRMNGGTQRGIIYISNNNGLSFYNAGYLYPEDKPFMYASQIMIGNRLISAYSFETGTAAPFASSTAGIHLATFEADNSGYFYKDSTGQISLLKQAGAPTTLYDRFRGFVSHEYAVHSSSEKTVHIKSDSTSALSKDIAATVGGDLLGPSNSSIINEITHTGVQSSPFTNTPMTQGVIPWSDTVSRIDSIAITGKYLSGAVGEDGNIYMAPSISGGSNLLKLNPQTKKVYYIPLGAASEYKGIAAVGRYMYVLANGLTQIKKVDIYTGAVSTITVGSNGWNGLSYAEGYLWSAKAISNQILKYHPVADTFTVLTTPSTGSWVAGPYDGRYQWFVGTATNYWLKVNPRTNEIFEVSKSLPLTGIGGTRNGAVFDGVDMWSADAGSNIVFRTNGYSGFSKTDTLPAGTYANAKWDGVSMWFINRTAPNLIKFNPKTNRYKSIATPASSATNKWSSAVFHNNRLYLVPEDAGKIAIITTVEFGGDPFQRIFDSTYIEQPVDTFSVGRVDRTRIVLGDVNNISSSYANPGGTGDRTASITVTTDLSMFGSATLWVNGNTSSDNTYFNPQAVVGKNITFDFGTSQYIQEAKLYQSAATSHGTWQWQGSEDGTTWENIGATFTLGGATTQTQTTLAANQENYRYYRLSGISGNAANTPLIYEFEFKIASTSENYAYITAKQGASDGGTIQISGDIRVPTATSGDNSTKVASTAFVQQATATPYAQYVLTGNYTYTSANTAQTVAFNTEYEESGITHDTGVNPANITFPTAGRYLVTATFNAYGTAGDIVRFSFQINSTDVTYSATTATLPVTNYYTPVTVTFVLNVAANDTVNVITSASATTATLQSIASGNGVAATPAAKIIIQKL